MANSIDSPLAAERRQLNKYQRFLISTNDQTILSPSGKIYGCAGDTVTVERISGSMAIYMKIEDSQNPWIRLRTGDEFTRPYAFNKIIIAVADAGIEGTSGLNLPNSSVYAILYVSHGPLLKRRNFRNGFGKNSPSARNCQATSVPQYLFKDYYSPPSSGAAALLSAGTHGGTLILKNQGASDLILILTSAGLGVVTTAAEGFPISQNETIVLDLDRSLTDLLDDVTAVLLPKVFVEVGTGLYSWILSSNEADAGQFGQNVHSFDAS